MFTSVVCCLVVGLWVWLGLGLGLDLVCDRLVVMYTYLYYFPLSLSHCHLLVGSFVIECNKRCFLFFIIVAFLRVLTL